MMKTAEVLLIGAGATAFIDLAAIARRRLTGAKAPDYRLLGRWLALMPKGRFVHEALANVRPARAELVIGWSAHYLTGMLFASLLPLICGRAWLSHPTLLPALLVGI